MAAIQYIDINEFMDTLKSNGLLIISSKEWETAKAITARRLMKKPALCLSDIANNDLLGKKMTKKTVNQWIIDGKIKEKETYREATGTKRVMILTTAIKRLNP
jgi:hypothetical protein